MDITEAQNIFNCAKRDGILYNRIIQGLSLGILDALRGNAIELVGNVMWIPLHVFQLPLDIKSLPDSLRRIADMMETYENKLQ